MLTSRSTHSLGGLLRFDWGGLCATEVFPTALLKVWASAAVSQFSGAAPGSNLAACPAVSCTHGPALSEANLWCELTRMGLSSETCTPHTKSVGAFISEQSKIFQESVLPALLVMLTVRSMHSSLWLASGLCASSRRCATKVCSGTPSNRRSNLLTLKTKGLASSGLPGATLTRSPPPKLIVSPSTSLCFSFRPRAFPFTSLQ